MYSTIIALRKLGVKIKKHGNKNFYQVKDLGPCMQKKILLKFW